jgi:hypothetical protein
MTYNFIYLNKTNDQRDTYFTVLLQTIDYQAFCPFLFCDDESLNLWAQ